MSAIANFKKRREAAKAQQSPTATKTTATLAPENEALSLLSKLFNCSNELAISAAEAFVGKGLHIVDDEVHMFEPNPHYVDHTSGKDEAVITEATEQQKINAEVGVKLVETLKNLQKEQAESTDSVSDAAETAIDAADKVSDSADKVSSAAGDLESAASSVDNSASNLAYTADDLGQVAAELKEATAELKKPSAAQESSHGAKAAAPKSSSKK